MIKVRYCSFCEMKYICETLENYSNDYVVLDYQIIKEKEEYTLIIRYTEKEEN